MKTIQELGLTEKQLNALSDREFLLLRYYDGLDPHEWFHKNAARFFFTAKHIVENSERWMYNAGSGGPGVYFLIANRQIVYVGKAERCCSRINAHERDRREFDSIFCIEIEQELPREWLEAIYIAGFDPCQNRKPGRLPIEFKKYIAEIKEQ